MGDTQKCVDCGRCSAYRLIVDETHRKQLRELNELNWKRLCSELHAEGAAIRSDLEKRLDATDKRLDMLVAAIDGRRSVIDAHLPRIEAVSPGFEQRIDAMFARFETRMTKAMFVLWVATVVPLAMLIVAFSRAVQR